MIPERYHRLREALARRQPDLTVLMDQVHKRHNLSAIIRSCDAVGILEAHAVPPDEGLELSHSASAGAKKWVSASRPLPGPLTMTKRVCGDFWRSCT